MTEIRVLDTYWSDHCRHTTFSELKDVALTTAITVRRWKRPIRITLPPIRIFMQDVRQIRVPDGHCLNGDEAPQKEI